MPNALLLSGPCELEASAEGTTLRKFSMVGYTGGVMKLPNFYDPVVVDLAGVKVPSPTRPILRDHQPSRIVGHSESVEVTAKRITVKGVISGVGPDAQEVTGLAANGFPWQASIGASIDRREYVEPGVKVQVNGRSFVGPLIVVRASTLGEISFVSLGADGNTSATIAASGGNPMDFETWVKGKGFDPATLTEGQRTFLTASFDAEHKVKPVEPVVVLPVVDLKAEREKIAAETNRVAAVRTICAKYGNPTMTIGEGDAAKLVNIEAHAVVEGWDVTKTELEAMRSARPASINSVKPDNSGQQLAALQGAMLLRAGLRLDNPLYQSRAAVAMNLPAWLRAGLNTDQRQRAMEAAHRFGDMSMVDLAAAALRVDGRDAPHNRHDMIQASFSGSALTNIFTTNVNTMILATYGEATDSTVGWVKETEVADFKTNERPRMTKSSGLVKLPRGATADHMDRSDVGESFKIARYAKQFVIDEQDMVDDAFNALADTPKEMGLAAARLRPDLVYAILLLNGNLTATGLPIFSDSNTVDNNLATALSAAALRTAVATLNKMTENSVNLNLMPTHLLLPSSLRHLGFELVNSAQILVKGNTDAERGSINALAADGITPVSDARLENGVVNPASGASVSGSATAWYLVSNQGHTIEVAYLRGTGRSPQVRSFVLSQGQWGIGWDVNMDIGAKALDWRAMIKS